jgi:hypothetical protein
VWRSAIRQRTGAHMSAIAVFKNETERLVRNFFVESPLNYEHERLSQPSHQEQYDDNDQHES